MFKKENINNKNILTNSKDTKSTLEKKKEFIKLFDLLSNLYTNIYDEDSEFDVSSRIVTGLGRIQMEVEDMKDEVEKEFDFRDLKFEGYHLEDDIDKSDRNVWFVSDDTEDNSIHIYQPEYVNIDMINSNQYKYVMVVEILVGCQHYKTMVIDARNWIADLEEVGVEQNLKDFADYIFKNSGL